MSEFKTKKADFQSALQGSNPDLAQKIVDWLNGPAATTTSATPPAHTDGDDDVIIIHH